MGFPLLSIHAVKKRIRTKAPAPSKPLRKVFDDKSLFGTLPHLSVACGYAQQAQSMVGSACRPFLRSAAPHLRVAYGYVQQALALVDSAHPPLE